MAQEYLSPSSVATKGDTQRTLLVKQLTAATGAAAGPVARGTGSPVGVVNATAYSLYVQTDSTPPGVVWWSDGTNWH